MSAGNQSRDPCVGFRFVVALVALGCSQIALAQIHKWTDEDGQVHYSSTPPPQGARALDAPSGEGVSTVSDSNTDRGAREAFLRDRRTKREAEAAAAAERAEARAEKARRCAEARKRYAQLTGPERLYRTDENGDRHFLSSAELDAERSDAREQVRQYCR